MTSVKQALRRMGVRRPGAAARLEAEVARLRARNDALQDRVDRLVAKKESLQARLPKPTAVRAVPGRTRLELRRERVLAGVPDGASILEIGPAHNAILPKRDGFGTRTVDYLDQAGLRERYREFSQYDLDAIEEVDYVLPPGAAMADPIGDRFDLVVAAHVIEHTTSMIDFLNECTKLLVPGGRLALVVPDHRFCFDRFRERSAIGRVIDASLAPPSVHTPGSVIEERLNAVRHRGTTSWAPKHRGTYSFVHPLDLARASGEEARLGERYIDTHNWVLTPHHLRLMLQDLHDLGFIALRETAFHDTVRNEFFLSLSVDGPGSGLWREELQVLADDERRSLDHAVFGDAD